MVSEFSEVVVTDCPSVLCIIQDTRALGFNRLVVSNHLWLHNFDALWT